MSHGRLCTEEPGDPLAAQPRKGKLRSKKDPGQGQRPAAPPPESPVQVCLGRLETLETWRLMSEENSCKGHTSSGRLQLSKKGAFPLSSSFSSIQATRLLFGSIHSHTQTCTSLIFEAFPFVLFLFCLCVYFETRSHYIMYPRLASNSWLTISKKKLFENGCGDPCLQSSPLGG